jgi:hypothetical protein
MPVGIELSVAESADQGGGLAEVRPGIGSVNSNAGAAATEAVSYKK